MATFASEADLVDKSRAKKTEWKAQRRQEAKKLREKAMELGDLEDEADQDFYWNYRQGEKAQAAKIWKGHFKEPSGYTKPPKNQEKAPHIKATIDWVHGYRGCKSRNNVRYLADGSIGYFVAGLGVVYDPETHSQRHFDKHTDDITAIAFSPDRKTVATGEIGKQPKIYVWDSRSMQVIQKLQGKLATGIKCMAFSSSGRHLVAVDVSADHQVAVFSVKSGACVAIAVGDKASILDVAWRDDSTFATAGLKHFKLWTFSKGLASKRAMWGKQSDRNLACVAFHKNQALTGGGKGTLVAW